MALASGPPSAAPPDRESPSTARLATKASGSSSTLPNCATACARASGSSSRRREAELRPDFVRRLHDRLEQEPSVVAPHTRLSHRVVRYTLPLAAGVAGITLVAWLAMNAGQPPGAAVAVRPAPASIAAGPSRAVSDYLTVHQEFSPSTTMQGLQPYVRTIADESGVR